MLLARLVGVAGVAAALAGEELTSLVVLLPRDALGENDLLLRLL